MRVTSAVLSPRINLGGYEMNKSKKKDKFFFAGSITRLPRGLEEIIWLAKLGGGGFCFRESLEDWKSVSGIVEEWQTKELLIILELYLVSL